MDAPAERPSRRPSATGVAAVLSGVLLAGILVAVLAHDVTDEPIVADQSSYLLQALSLGHDGDLVLDAGDLQQWDEVHWTADPNGLFSQRDGETITFAKPYAYSVLLAAPVRVLGVRWGVAVVDAALLAVTFGAAALVLVRRLGAPAGLAFASGLVLVSAVGLSAFALGVELFFAAGVALAALAAQRARDGRALAALALAVVAGVLVAEKAPMLLAVGPLVALVAWRSPTPGRRLAVVGLAAATFALAVTPYLWASGGDSPTPYGGERYVSYQGVLPTDAALAEDPPRVARTPTDEVVSASYVADALTSEPGPKAKAAVGYLVGRHTGMVVWVPTAVIGLGLALLAVRRWSGLGVAGALGLAAYVAFYVLLFPGNYYGGGQSLGNRYFVQVAPLVALVVAEAGIARVRVLVGSLVGMAVAVVLLWPQMASPGDALIRLDRTSPVQRLFPFESFVDEVRYLRPLEIPEQQQPVGDR